MVIKVISTSLGEIIKKLLEGATILKEFFAKIKEEFYNKGIGIS